jgi:hypothetical protein
MLARITCVSLATLALLASGSAGAQDDSNLVQVITVHVRPAANTQFEEYVRAVREASRKQNQTNFWLASQSVSGEPTYTFNIARSGGYADLVSPGPELLAAFGAKEGERLLALGRSSIESTRSAFYRTQADLSVPPPESNPTPVAVLYSHISFNPGTGAQFAEMSRKTREASLAITPSAYYLTQTPNLGATGVRVVGLIQSWADLDRPTPGPAERVLQHFGPEEGGRINAMANGMISNIEYVLNRTRPDLNYQPDN